MSTVAPPHRGAVPGSWRRRGFALVTAIILLLLAGVSAATVMVERDADRAAARVHVADRLELQTTLAGLTRQYLLLSFAELASLAGQQPWQTGRPTARDAAVLAQFRAGSPLLSYGAALTDLTGRALDSAVVAHAALPPAADPGYAPMRAGLLSGRPGLSSVLHSGGASVVALAVPVPAPDGPAGLLVGYADTSSWPLQQYVAHLQVGPQAVPAVLDSTGAVVAGGRPAAADGSAGMLARSGPTRLVRYRSGGHSFVATEGPVGVGGWRLVTAQPAAVFDGSASRRRALADLLILLSLITAVTVLTLGLSARHRAARQLAEGALFDPLTGLPQRRYLDLRLATALSRQARDGTPVGILVGDLDGFKAVNDQHGHRRGDQVLIEVAHRLRGCVREEDFLVRLGGDEFVVVVETCPDGEILAALAARICAALADPFVLDRGQVQIGISLGGVVAASGDAELLLDAADAAMYAAKAAATGPVITNLLTASPCV